MLYAYFCHSHLSQVVKLCIDKGGFTCCLYCPKSTNNGWRCMVLVVFLQRWRKICTIFQWEAWADRVPEEMFQTLLTNLKQVNQD
jgi:hypothetical protein